MSTFTPPEISSSTTSDTSTGEETRFNTTLADQLEKRMPAQPDLSTSLPSPYLAFRDESIIGRPCNVGRSEQKLRLAAGTALLAAAAFAPLGRGWRIGLAAAGVAELVTGAIRYCPISQLLGVNTCREG